MLSCLIPQFTQSQPNALLSDIDAAKEKTIEGHLQQELQLAGDYMTGHGVARNITRSAYWYHKAADQGYPGAQVQLGYFYLTGLGVERNEAEAAKWFERAAASGSKEGKLNLAVLYIRGSVVPRDPHLLSWGHLMPVVKTRQHALTLNHINIVPAQKSE